MEMLYLNVSKRLLIKLDDYGGDSKLTREGLLTHYKGISQCQINVRTKPMPPL